MELWKVLILLLSAKTVLMFAPQPANIELTRTEKEIFDLEDIYAGINYKVNLYLDNHLFTKKGRHFRGAVEIAFTLKECTDHIDIHSDYRMIQVNNIAFDGEDIVRSQYSVNKVTDVLRINLSYPLITERLHFLVIEYTGTVSTDEVVGLYKGSYVNMNNDTKYFLVTQLAPTYARKLFPCFDEPRFKAHFNFSVIFPSDLNVWSNTPEITRPSKFKGTGEAVVHFHQTPEMSTYLLGLVVSDFTCAQLLKGNVIIQTCSRQGVANEIYFALDMVPEILNQLAIFTSFDYSQHRINKLDIIAVPNFPHFVMENWGLLIIRETKLLYNSWETSKPYQEDILHSLAHGIAQQWFGNLVTFKRWSEKFMNEGLATYFQFLTIHELFPELKAAKRFVVDVLHPLLDDDSQTTLLANLGLDGIETTGEIDFVYNEPTQRKGSCLIRMVQYITGMNKFKRGIQNFIQINKFKNNVGIGNLWSELGTFTADFPTSLSTVMHNWIWESGYPIVNVIRTGNLLTISQSSFRYTGLRNQPRWYIPITYTVSTHIYKFKKTIPDFWLTPESDYQRNITVDFNWIILNNRQGGYYRVLYENALLKQIQSALLKKNFDGIIDINRAQIVDDSFAFAKANLMTYSCVFETIEFLKNDVSYYPWKAAFKGFKTILNNLGEDTPVGKKAKNHILKLMDTFYNSVMLRDVRQENYMYTTKQALAAEWACKMGNEHCKEEAIRLFDLMIDSGRRPPLELRKVIYCNGMRYGGNEEKYWHNMWLRYKTERGYPVEQQIIRNAMACMKSTFYLSEYLGKTITEEYRFRPQDITSIFAAVASNPLGTNVAFDFFIENQDAIAKYSRLDHEREMIFLTIAFRLRSEERIQKLKKLIEDGDLNTEFMKHRRKASYIINVGEQWRNKHSEDLNGYYNRISFWWYILLGVIVFLVVMCCLLYSTEIKDFFWWGREFNLNVVLPPNRRRERWILVGPGEPRHPPSPLSSPPPGPPGINIPMQVVAREVYL